MDLEDFKELFEYNHEVRTNYLDSFQIHPGQKIYVKPWMNDW